MANQKHFYYVGVQTQRGMQFVTDIDYSNKTTHWKANEKPLALTKSEAEDLRFGLCMNFHFAVIVDCHFELDRQYFCTEENPDNPPWEP